MATENTNHIATFYSGILQKHPLLYAHQWVIEFIAPFGETGYTDDAFGRADSTDTECFAYWGQSATLPSLSISNVTVSYLSQDFVVPGVIDFGSNTWDVSLLLDQDLTQYKKLESWRNLISDTSKSGGGRKVIPNVQAKLNILDNTMQNIIKTFVLEGVWIASLGEISFAPEAGGAGRAECTASFQYQYFYEANDLENPTAADPLSYGVFDTVAAIAETVIG